MKISPKRNQKSILEEAQTSRAGHVKQAVPNSKGRTCHAKETNDEDRKSTRSARAKGHDRATKIGRARSACAKRHSHASCPVVAWSARALRHGRAAIALLRFGFKRRNFVHFWGVSLARFSFVAAFFSFLMPL